MVTATPSLERPSTMTTNAALSHRRVASALLALLLMAGAAACGTSGGDDAAPTTTRATSTTDRSDTSDPGGAGTTDSTDASPTSETERTTTTRGDGKATGSEQDYIDALVGSFDPKTDGEDLTRDQVSCLAKGWVHSLGVSAFEKAGLSPDDIAKDDGGFQDLHISKAQAERMVDVYGNCGIDIKAMMLKSFASDTSKPEQQACIENKLTDDAVRSLLVESLVEDQPSKDNPVMQVLMACMAGGG